jgi:hypothetical protein
MIYLKRMCKGAVRVCFKVRCQNFLLWRRKTMTKPRSWWPVSRPDFEPRTFHIQSRSANHSPRRVVVLYRSVLCYYYDSWLMGLLFLIDILIAWCLKNENLCNRFKCSLYSTMWLQAATAVGSMLQQRRMVDLITPERSCCHHVHASATMRCRRYYILTPHRSPCVECFPRLCTFLHTASVKRNWNPFQCHHLLPGSVQEWNIWPY